MMPVPPGSDLEVKGVLWGNTHFHGMNSKMCGLCDTVKGIRAVS